MLGASKITFQRWGLGVNSEIRENRRRGKGGEGRGEREGERGGGEAGKVERFLGWKTRAGCLFERLFSDVGRRTLFERTPSVCLAFYN